MEKFKNEPPALTNNSKVDSKKDLATGALKVAKENEEFQKKIKELEKEIENKEKPLLNEI